MHIQADTRRRASTIHRRGLVTPLILVIAGGVGFLSSLVVNPQFPTVAIAAYIATGMYAAVLLRFAVHRDARDVVLIVVAGLTYTIYFMPLLRDRFIYQPTQQFSLEALSYASWFAVLGFAALIAGYYAAKSLPIGPVLRTAGAYPIRGQTLARYSTVLQVAALLDVTYRNDILIFQAALGRTTFLLDQLPLLAIALGGLAILNGHRSLLFKIQLFGLFVPAIVLITVARTLFYHLLVLLVPLLVMYMLRHRRFPVFYGGVIAIVLVPVFKARIEERIAHGYLDEASTWELVQTGWRGVIDAMTTRDAATLGRRDDLAAARLNSLSLLADVVMAHQFHDKPFKYGETFWWLPLAPIPRFLFPSKPQNDHADTFPIEYGLKTASDRYAIVLPLLVETYINGGWLGILLLNLLIGVAYFGISAAFRHGEGVVNMLALLSVLALSIYVENNITLVMGAALQAILAWAVIDLIVARRLRAAVAARQRAVRRAMAATIRTGGAAPPEPT